MENIGLVLEGGGMRGTYTSGVLDFFIEKELYFPYVIGVSAGACNAASYISKQKERSKRININYIKNPKYLSFRNLIREKSVFGIKFAYDEIPNKLEPFDYDTFNNSSQKFLIVTTDCLTGKPVYFEKNDCKDILKVIRASSSLPLIAPMVEIDGGLYLDGGISDSIPIKKAMEDGYENNIIILTRDKSYRKSPMKFQRLIKRKYKKYPRLIDTILNRYKVYNETLDYIERLENDGRVFVIRPSKDLKVSRLEKNPKKLEAIYKLGYEDMNSMYEKMKKWMEEQK
ncbi:patatin-like phospholipase family protein [Clostridium sp.]|jgi:predicted patatin/cPLA2 family phospholipase|uniref:patatin-like phospholipase family protein n=1 Tax=Clostridium sp. TaxID=1506 RepID=UPI0039F50699